MTLQPNEWFGSLLHLPKLRMLWQRAAPEVIRSCVSRIRTRSGVSLAAADGNVDRRAFDGFEQEVAACEAGRRLFEQTIHTGSVDGASFQLRRNVHRLEKGFAMRPRRSLFATEYILETVSIYRRLVELRLSACNAESIESPDPLLIWAHDVLRQYFHSTGIDDAGPENAVVVARRQFENVKHPRSNGRSVPEPRGSQPPPISVDAFHNLARRRRSVRWFLTDRPVPRELLDRAVEVASLSPSACNRQPFHFRLFDDPALVRRIADIPMGTNGWAHQIPCLCVLVGQLRAFPLLRDRHVIYVDGGLASMSFQFALECQGLASCSINWPDIQDREVAMAKLLGLAPDERPVMLMAIGWPDPNGLIPHSAKRPLQELLSYNAAPVEAFDKHQCALNERENPALIPRLS